jgi:glycosyltransferase involved in cell wall biosynthesis
MSDTTSPPSTLPRILLISHDIVGDSMAGPGIRYLTLARVLARHCPLTFAIPNPVPASLTHESFQVCAYARHDWSSLEALARAHDALIFPSDIATDFPQMANVKACLAVDGYDPLMAEWLAIFQARAPDELVPGGQERLSQLKDQLSIGDFFFCASERQRDWWLGMLEGAGRINPYTIAADPSLRNLIDVVPYGVDDAPRATTRRAIRGVWPGVGPTDKLILWGGGLWNWLDPLTAIRAMAQVSRVREDVKLIFPGTRHPNPMLDGMPTHTRAARDLAEELGLADKTVLFGDWVPYEAWPAVLLESDLALSLHFDTYETRLAFRSRMLGYIWAGLPTIATRGDATGDLIAAYGLGELVDVGDADGVAAAILRWLDVPRATFESSFDRARTDYAWERAAGPLIRFCQNPSRAADRAAGLTARQAAGEPQPASPAPDDGALRDPLASQEALRRERDQLRAKVAGFERGRFIRLMRWLKTRARAL